MIDQGYAATTPTAASSIVAERAASLDRNTEPAAEGTPRDFELDPEQLRHLQEFELAVNAADHECQRTTGLEKWMYDEETAILETLRREFPDFAGAPG